LFEAFEAPFIISGFAISVEAVVQVDCLDWVLEFYFDWS